MEFLKEILGEELYKQVEEKINAHNGIEENKDKQIKIGNLGTGEYVGKGKYDALQEIINGKDTELKSANDLIAQLKKDTKGNEELQGKISAYEAENAKLQAELQETKIKSAIKVSLLSEKAKDIDYLTYQLEKNLKEKGEALELDENENIKGWDNRISDLKTQFPTFFENGNGQRTVLGANGLPEGDNGPRTVTKEQFLKMGYNDRLALKQENEQLYKQLAKN